MILKSLNSIWPFQDLTVATTKSQLGSKMQHGFSIYQTAPELDKASFRTVKHAVEHQNSSTAVEDPQHLPLQK